MNGQLRLTTLGDFTITLGSKRITGFASRKVEALLVYLAVERGISHRRETLLSLLWPGMPEKSARNNLRQVLFSLRQKLPEVAPVGGGDPVPLVLADRQIVRINPDAELDVDIHQLEDLIGGTKTHDHLSLASCGVCTEALEKAVALYKGNFLADFYLEDSNQFESWAEANREAHRRKALHALDTLTDIRTQQGRFKQALVHAEQQLRIDPLRENAYRQMMELFSKGGQRAEALRVYQRCEVLLERELGVQPSRETVALYEIISGDEFHKEITPQKGNLRGYEIREYLGAGHSALVYRAFQPVVNRDVAVKVIRPEFANHPDFIRRFDTEAQLVARLEHPHIVPLYDYWRDPGGAYLVMRWIRGGSLSSDLANGPWMLLPAVRLMDQLTAALTLAHRQGVVHCDIKPANILLDEEGNAYLSDFGIAILTGPLAQMSGYRWSGNDGTSTGSLGYSSPEVAKGLEPTIYTDIYSLGVVLFEILTGLHPFPGLEGQALVQKHLNERLPPVGSVRPDLPEALDGIIQKATEKDPALRFKDVEALGDAFRTTVLPESSPVEIEAVASVEIRNPYKGLQPFKESDAMDFYGREDLIQRLLGCMVGEDPIAESRPRFLAVVGPSGSGKSSVVKAGLIPAIRSGKIAGSERWFLAEMTPGSQPMVELENALLRIAVQTPSDLLGQLKMDPDGLLRVLEHALPGIRDEVLLVIDQFEEIYTLVEDEAERDQFLQILAAAVNAPHCPLRLVITLRADFYDRPLQHSQFGELVRENTEVVLPLTPEKLERAICAPAEGVGVRLETSLVARIVQDVGDQPGSLPLLQYMLTELFERREGTELKLEAYESSGGILGILGKRAEVIFGPLDPDQKFMTRQIFLRLVTLGEGTEDIRRRTLLSELMELENDPTRITVLLDVFGRYRLLTFDHDPVTRAPTVEVAHEALLREWPRLRSWLDESRDDVRTQRQLNAAAGEWHQSQRDSGFLLRDTRLDHFTAWAQSTSLALTDGEKAYLEASLDSRRKREQAEAERQAHEKHLEQRSQSFARLLAGVFALAAIVSVVLSMVAFNQRGIAQQNEATAIAAQVQAKGLAESEAQARLTQQALVELESQARSAAESESQAKAVAEAKALEERDRALQAQEDAARQASIGLAAQAQLEINDTYPERAILLGLEALENYPYTWQAESALGQIVQDFRLQVILTGHVGDVKNIAWSPDGTRIATTDKQGYLWIWDSVNFNPLLIIEAHSDYLTYLGEPVGIQSLAWSPDGNRIVTTSRDNTARVWDSTSGDLLVTFSEHTDWVTSVSWHPNATWIATTGVDATVRIWDPVSGEQPFVYTGHSGRIHTVDWSPDGKLIATASEDGSAYIWDVELGDEILSLDQHNGPVTDIDWSPDGSQVATSGQDGTIRLWNAYTGEQKAMIFLGDSAWKVAWAPDGSQIATASADGVARVWDHSTNELLFRLQGRINDQFDIAWSPNSKHLGTTSGPDFSARIWDASSHFIQLPAGGSIVWVSWSPDSTKLALAGSKKMMGSGIGQASVWDVITKTELFKLGKNMDEINCIYWSPNGKLISTSGMDGLARIYDAESGEEVLTFSKHLEDPPHPLFDPDIYPIWGGDWSPDSKYVATSSGTGIVWVWEAMTGNEIFQVDVAPECCSTFASWSPDGSKLATSDIPHNLQIIDARTGEHLWGEPAESNEDSSLGMSNIWSPDGRWILTTGLDANAMIWDVESMEVQSIFSEHATWIAVSSWSPNSQRIATPDISGVVKIWDAMTAKELLSFQVPFQDFIYSLSWSPDGKWVAVGSLKDFVNVYRVWQTKEDLIQYTKECCVVRELTQEERNQFGLPEIP